MWHCINVSVLCSFTAGRARLWWWYLAYIWYWQFMAETFSVYAKLIKVLLMNMNMCWVPTAWEMLWEEIWNITQHVAPYNYRHFVYYIHKDINAELILEWTWKYLFVNDVLCLEKLYLFNFIFFKPMKSGKVWGGKYKKICNICNWLIE